MDVQCNKRTESKTKTSKQLHYVKCSRRTNFFSWEWWKIPSTLKEHYRNKVPSINTPYTMKYSINVIFLYKVSYCDLRVAQIILTPRSFSYTYKSLVIMFVLINVATKEPIEEPLSLNKCAFFFPFSLCHWFQILWLIGCTKSHRLTGKINTSDILFLLISLM